jgi:hypothetical protein
MYVGALAMNTTEKSLTDYFSQFGDVSNCQVGLIFFTSRLDLVRTYPFFTVGFYLVSVIHLLLA